MRISTTPVRAALVAIVSASITSLSICFINAPALAPGYRSACLAAASKSESTASKLLSALLSPSIAALCQSCEIFLPSSATALSHISQRTFSLCAAFRFAAFIATAIKSEILLAAANSFQSKSAIGVSNKSRKISCVFCGFSRVSTFSTFSTSRIFNKLYRIRRKVSGSPPANGESKSASTFSGFNISRRRSSEWANPILAIKIIGEIALCNINGIEFESWATGMPKEPKVLLNVAVLAPGERKMIAILL